VPDDIRDRTTLNAEDVLALNFVRNPPKYVFRRHFVQGLRSHIMEVLDPQSVERETSGVLSGGIKWFPRARPQKMLRIFRTKFDSRREAYDELRRVEVIARYLGPARHARSEEFLVSYRLGRSVDILLCGLQEYVEGLPIEPWEGFLNADRLVQNLIRPGIAAAEAAPLSRQRLIQTIQHNALEFVRCVKRMIAESGLIPDLAGEGNLILTDDGQIKLVDINNISPVIDSPRIALDDKGYPVCDKSVEALFQLETHLAAAAADPNRPPYRTFLDPARKINVTALEKTFHQRLHQREQPPG
jgi:hypothetical protein